MQPVTPTISEIATAYVAYCQSNDEAFKWSSSAVIDIWLEKRWDDLWQLVWLIALLPQDIDDQTLATISAGPLEDLLGKAGPAYIDQVLALAKRTPRLSRMLTGVWRNAIEEPVWGKVVQFCRKSPNPIDGTYPF